MPSNLCRSDNFFCKYSVSCFSSAAANSVSGATAVLHSSISRSASCSGAPACLPDPSTQPALHGVPPQSQKLTCRCQHLLLPESADLQRTHGRQSMRTSTPRPCVRRGCAWRTSRRSIGCEFSSGTSRICRPLPFRSSAAISHRMAVVLPLPARPVPDPHGTLSLSFHSYLIIAQPSR